MLAKSMTAKYFPVDPWIKSVILLSMEAVMCGTVHYLLPYNLVRCHNWCRHASIKRVWKIYYSNNKAFLKEWDRFPSTWKMAIQCTEGWFAWVFIVSGGGWWYVVRITPHLPELHGLKLPLRATRGSMHLSNQLALETEIGTEAHQHQTSEMNSDFWLHLGNWGRIQVSK